jgi:hypothetical protein
LRGELLIAAEGGDQLTSEGQRLPTRRRLAVNRGESPELYPGHRRIWDRYVQPAGAVMRPRFDGNAPPVSVILQARLRRCRVLTEKNRRFVWESSWIRPPDDVKQEADLIGPKGVASLPSLIHCSAVPRWL